MRFEFTSPLWEWSTQSAPWYFITVPDNVGDDIREIPRMPRGFGAVRVRVTVGDSTWLTSLFPESRMGSYWLPVKKAVRQAEGLELGAPVVVRLELVEL